MSCLGSSYIAIVLTPKLDLASSKASGWLKYATNSPPLAMSSSPLPATPPASANMYTITVSPH